MLLKEEGHSTYAVGTANLVLCLFPSPLCDRPYANVRKINILCCYIPTWKSFFSTMQSVEHNKCKWTKIRMEFNYTDTLITSDESEKALRLMKNG